MNDPLIRKLMKDIPPFPAIADKVLHLARQTPVNFRKLATVIETDPVLSAMVIRMANSPIYGTSRGRVDSLERAIIVLGQYRIIDSTVIYITRTLRKISKASWGIGEIEFWKHSIGVAVAARMLANRMNISHAQQCFLAGLMHDIGKIALMSHDASLYKEAMRSAEETRRPLYYAELETFGITHSMVGAEICKSWFLPVTTVKAVAYHHDDPDVITLTVSNLVRSGDLFTKIAQIGDGGNPFAITDKKLLLPHPQFTEDHIFTFLGELENGVDELIGMVMENEVRQPSTEPVSEWAQDPNLKIQVLLRDESDRIMIKYVLYQMGYPVGTAAQSTHDNRVIKIVNETPRFLSENESAINFNEWKFRQPTTPQHNEVNISALHAWLRKSIESILQQSPV